MNTYTAASHFSFIDVVSAGPHQDFRLAHFVTCSNKPCMYVCMYLLPLTGVTVIWVSPCFGYPRTQIPSVFGIPSRDTQNTESVKYRRLGQVKSSRILLKNHLYSYEALSQQMKAF